MAESEPRSLPEDVRESVRKRAAELGFAACRFTDALPLALGPLLESWIERGRHGDMDYLATDPEARLSPQRVLPGAASMVVVAMPYPAAPPLDPEWRERLTGRIAAYTLGDDYHDVMGAKLSELAETVVAAGGGQTSVHVDSGPLLERNFAERAGLGWLGHNTLLLDQGLGSYFLLGCLLTAARFAPDTARAPSRCGTCRACLPACPTGALDDGPTIDARRCVSYLTIEHRGPIDPALRTGLGNWVFGCDLCQEACPWNDDGAAHDSGLRPYLPDLLTLGPEEFRSRYRGTAVFRAKRRGLARNAAIALGNTGNPAAVDALATALADHDEALVRAHAAWALGRLATAASRAALAARLSRERVPPVCREIEAALGETT